MKISIERKHLEDKIEENINIELNEAQFEQIKAICEKDLPEEEKQSLILGAFFEMQKMELSGRLERAIEKQKINKLKI